MEEVSLIERVIGRPYCVVPRIVPNTRRQVYLDYLTTEGFSPGNILLYGPLHTLFWGHYDKGLYVPQIHTTYIPRGRGDERFGEFALLHELVHAFLHQKSKRFLNLVEELKQGLVEPDGNLSPDFVEEALIARTLDEGIADYVAIQCQKLQVAEGRSPSEVYCFAREWALANWDDPDKSRSYLTSTPLSSELAGKIEEKVDKILRHASSISRIEERDARSKLGHMLFQICMSPAMNCPGYYFTRATCEASEHIGDALERIINEPPKSFKDLQTRTLQSLGRDKV